MQYVITKLQSYHLTTPSSGTQKLNAKEYLHCEMNKVMGRQNVALAKLFDHGELPSDDVDSFSVGTTPCGEDCREFYPNR